METPPSFLKHLVTSPYGKARLREYYLDWSRWAWAEFRALERRGGLLLSLLVASAVLACDILVFGTSPQSIRAAVSLLGGMLLATLAALVSAFVRAPARMALRKEFEERETTDTLAEFGHHGLDMSGPPVLRFVTRNRERHLPVDSAGKTQVSALRFFGSIDAVVHRHELPKVLKLRRRRGRIVVKEFEGCLVHLGEERTAGVMIHAEVYYADDLPKHSVKSIAT